MLIPGSHSGVTKSSFNPVFSPYIIPYLSWYVGLTKNIEPDLKLQSSIPPASVHEAATCFSVERNEETAFSTPWRRHKSIYTTGFFLIYLLFRYTQLNKREKPKLLWALSFFTVLPFQRAQALFADHRYGDCKAAQTRFSLKKKKKMESCLLCLFSTALQIMHTQQILVFYHYLLAETKA